MTGSTGVLAEEVGWKEGHAGELVVGVASRDSFFLLSKVLDNKGK